jgi:L-seryl-tRNA(Ser) seleniumtransferase
MDERLSAAPGASAAQIPSLDRLLNSVAFAGLLAHHGRAQLTAALRQYLGELRQAALSGSLDPEALVDEALSAALAARLAQRARPRLRPVFNLTGTVLHTNLGRAVLPPEAVQALARCASAPVNLEFDLGSARRGDRDAIVETLLCELTGAEAATVVNNNAAAVLLILSALAARREVIVSRGELIEIGGSFRMPDIMRQAGARLVEVGTTNRTHGADYAQAIGERSALLMKVHTSNYVISGFTSSVPVAELARLAHAHALPLITDLGSGSLLGLRQWQLPAEPTVRDTVAAGADLVCFSGDKLVGGPQAGLIVGRTELIRRLKRHPLKRVLRVGKLTLAALEAVLAVYRSPEHLAERLPTLRQLTRAVDAMREQALRLQPQVQLAVGAAYQVSAAPMASQIGSGALPTEQLGSFGLVIRSLAARSRASGSGRGVERLAGRLRTTPRPIIARIADHALWLDLRCLEAADECEFLAQWRELGR